ncbi:hypothetical protein L9F63_009977, partial [Diploptera punctata]
RSGESLYFQHDRNHRPQTPPHTVATNPTSRSDESWYFQHGMAVDEDFQLIVISLSVRSDESWYFQHVNYDRTRAGIFNMVRPLTKTFSVIFPTYRKILTNFNQCRFTCVYKILSTAVATVLIVIVISLSVVMPIKALIVTHAMQYILVSDRTRDGIFNMEWPLTKTSSV